MKYDLTGKIFGELKVLNAVGGDKNGNMLWNCLCNCGTYTIKNSVYLRNGKSTSCGCKTKLKFRQSMKKYNKYDLSGEYGIGYTFKGEEFYFDLEDYDKIKEHCWHINGDGYVEFSTYGQTSTKMHHYITNIPSNIIIDHKNGKYNDNQKKNLRVATISENTQNSKKPSNNTSGYKGVHWNKQMNAWQARIQVEGKRYNLGYYDNVVDAAKAYNDAAIIYHGEFARLNEI